MVKYLCITCLYVGTDRVSFKTLDTIKPVLELFVPEIKSTSANGGSSLVCEQCFFFVKTVEQFRRRCAQSQQKISALNIEKNSSPTKASIGEVDSTSAAARLNNRRRSCLERAEAELKASSPAQKVRRQSNDDESAESVDTHNDDNDDDDDYYITRQDLVSAGILPEITGSASVDAKSQPSEAEESPKVSSNEPTAKKKKTVEYTPSLKASSNNPNTKCSACWNRCSLNRQQGKPARCDYCNFFSMEKTSLLKHLDTCHQELATPISLLSCQQCSFKCHSLIQLSIHRVKQHEEPANCSFRVEESNSTNRKHDLEDNYCLECVTIFLTVENYQEHMVEKHKRAVCSCCEQLFSL
ncbi:uncharacterized protein LOC109542416 isoform X2 [Dendroctonus ponderosae]|uniref:uncharacterized protein LOC109542416 isoform X2 n=1 Tax=Dendroctonus ponderosae TaxID=77166 RepID=UPI002034C802|nr:uncharacterized protein LOC109542416 isoform X2 [Dendroctonus ponderosae]